ncbi:MAG: F0F1 ATP synthase subunit A [Candidatus Margulisbacteria bacterium]|jgi:F-type H+-transporting ATPase subunit a|nr:F0F1 ATP synthase subunit A [Candidatus Margulisiibacteriota bacterium]
MPEAKTLLSWRLGGLDLSITSTIFFSFLAAFLLIVFLLLSARRLEFVPRRIAQNLLECLVEFMENQILRPAGLEARVWAPLFLSAFLFILFSGLPLGLLALLGPRADLSTAAANINGAAALAVLIFLIGLLARFKQHGFWGFFRSIVPSGVKGPVSLLLFPIEVISQLFKPFSLAVRLFANMSGGHVLLLSILGFTALFNNAAVWALSYGGAVLILFFELFVCFIQAYVFTFLSALLIGESIGGE